MAHRLLLAEDTRDLNRALTTVLEHEGYEVCSVVDGEEALHRLMQETFDGAILDIMMPKRTGLEVLQETRRRGNLVPILLLTAKAEIDDRVIGLDAGADDYLTKPFAMRELLARVRTMVRRQAAAPRRISFSDITLDNETFELASNNAVRLSVKEFELMQTLLLNAGKALTAGYLLDHVWRQEETEGVDTVMLYVSYLQGKLKWVGSGVTIRVKDGTFRLCEAQDAS